MPSNLTRPNFDQITYKPGTFGHLLKLSTINGIAVNAFPRWLVTSCYALILFGLYLAILKAIPWIALLFAGVAFFLLLQYGLKPARNLIRFLESNPHAWIRYSGIPPACLDPTLLNTSVDQLDQQRERFHQALRASTGEAFRALVAAVDAEAEVTSLSALDAMQQHLQSWDSSLFFAGSSRTGKTAATQHYAALLKPYYYSLKPDFMPIGVPGVQGALEQPDQFYDWLLPFYREFQYRVKHRLVDEVPLWVFIDELETNLTNLERWDRSLDKDDPKLLPETLAMLNGVLKLGNAHQVRLGLITQSILSKNTRLDSDSMSALSWLLCGSELGGFGAFKSDRIKSRCSEQTLGQVKMMTDHPDGVRGFWWLIELRGNFRLLPAPPPIPESALQQIPHFNPNQHPFQGRQLASGQAVELTMPTAMPSSHPGMPAGNFWNTAQSSLHRLGDGIKYALGVEAEPTSPPVAANTIEADLQQVRDRFAGDAELLDDLNAIAPLIPDLDVARQGIVLFSLKQGAIQARHLINFAPGKGKLYRPLKTEGVKQLFYELEALGIGEVSATGDDDPNPYYRALKLDSRTFSPNS